MREKANKGSVAFQSSGGASVALKKKLRASSVRDARQPRTSVRRVFSALFLLPGSVLKLKVRKPGAKKSACRFGFAFA